MFQKFIFWSMTAAVGFLVVVILLLQTSFFQNAVAYYVLDQFNKRTGQTILFEGIRIAWFDKIEFLNIRILDYQHVDMISASKVMIDYNMQDLLLNDQWNLDEVDMHEGKLNLVKYQDSLDLNLLVFVNAIKASGRSQGAKKTRSPLRLVVEKIQLDHFVFVYNNQLLDSLDNGKFDYRHFTMKIPEAAFDNFNFIGDTIRTRIISFRGTDSLSGLKVSQLHAHFELTPGSISFGELLLKTPQSTLRDEVRFEFEKLADLNHFISRVRIRSHLNRCSIHSSDLQYFVNVNDRPFDFEMSAEVDGYVSRMSVDNLSLDLGQYTTIHGSLDLLGLPVLKETFVDARINNGFLYPDDLKEFLGDIEVHFEQLGEIGVKGRFLGFAHDFVANAEFHTSQGVVNSDINLKFPEGWNTVSYSGNIEMQEFNMGALIQNSRFIQNVTGKGKINGKGVSLETARFRMDAEFFNTGLFGYPYKYIKASGDFASSYFKGNLIVDDPNCIVEGDGTLDLRNSTEKIDARIEVGYMNLYNLGLAKRELELKTDIQADLSGLHLDSLVGTLQLGRGEVFARNQSLALDTVSLKLSRRGIHRKISLDMEQASLDLEGDFYISYLMRDIGKVYEDLANYFDRDTAIVRHPVIINENYAVDLSLKYKDINSYLALINDQLTLSSNGSIEGTYYQRKNATLSLFGEIDTIQYMGVHYLQNVVDVHLSKDIDSLGIIGNIYLESAKQVWPKIEETQNFTLEAVWADNEIGIVAKIEQPENNSSLNVNGDLTIFPDHLDFRFLPSELIAFGDRWDFNPYNSILVGWDQVEVRNMEIFQGEQSVKIAGIYSDSSETNLHMSLKEVDLSGFSGLFSMDLSGIVNSEMSYKREDYTEPFQFINDLSIRQLSVEQFLIGDIKGNSYWDKDRRALRVDYGVRRSSVETISLNGYYLPEGQNQKFDIMLQFDQADLRMFEPFFTDQVSNISGKSKGKVYLSGTSQQPILKGKCDISNGKFTIDYLNVSYQFDGGIEFDNRKIIAKRIKMIDKDGNVASLSGTLIHTGFRDVNVDVAIDADEFLFLNTTSQDNTLYYGTVKATANVNIEGPLNDVLIKASGTTNSGTRFYIPLETESDIEQKEYISFVSFKDSTNRENIEEVFNRRISGVRLDFDLDVTPDAYIELIFDIRTGDIIRGRGKGNLNMTMDTQGEFQLFGDISIAEGAYNFTIPNFINKEFNIQPGSTISWYGDPYEGVLNLQASYRQPASLAGYNSYIENAQRYSFLVVLKLNGYMLSPRIDFEIQADESLAQLNSTEQAYLQSINNNEQELKRQVFSLLILRKFSPQNSFLTGGGGSAVGSSLSEFFSNQFSYYLSQVDENLEVDIDLSGLDPNAFNTFQLRLAYTFLDGRLRVSGGGSFPSANEDSPHANTNNFIGDWAVRYLLTKDGHLRIRAFSQAKQSIATTAGLYRETGFSFQYVNSFNEFSDLLTRSREDALKEKETEPEEEVNEAIPTSSVQ